MGLYTREHFRTIITMQFLMKISTEMIGGKKRAINMIEFSHYFAAQSLKKLPLIQLAVGGQSL